ncbi:hypothetical protein BC628DRAFT_66461 [Trametes gibbosa]|nr:hypothetical protein BC628DRAFT_66461 [Trametes gibbosa]
MAKTEAYKRQFPMASNRTVVPVQECDAEHRPSIYSWRQSSALDALPDLVQCPPLCRSSTMIASTLHDLPPPSHNIMATPSATSSNPTPGQSAGAGLGNTVKGAFQTVHGLGDSIRGNAMDFVDAATGTAGGRRHTETDVGRQQTEQGIGRMEDAHHHTPVANPSATTTAPPPLPARHENASVGVQTDGTQAGGQGVGQTR